MEDETGLISRQETQPWAALRAAVSLWADSTSDVNSPRRQDMLRDKQQAVEDFFKFIKKSPTDVTALDVKAWQQAMESRGLAPATVYYRISRLSSFYSWAMRNSSLGQLVSANPVRLARPKAPKKYQTESTRALSDEQLRALIAYLRGCAKAEGDIVAKRDYALLLFYVMTGMRRREVISLRGNDIEFRDDGLIIRSKVKGGDYVGRQLQDNTAGEALVAYLQASNRLNVLSSARPLWTRHDTGGTSGATLSSHAFVRNLKRYAKAVGIGAIHLHQMRHTFARLVAEQSGSITETQDALGHRNVSTTRVYVQRIAIRRDKYSAQIAQILDLKEQVDPDKPD